MTDSQALAGITVAVTRPAAQAVSLCRLIEAHGGTSIAFPAIEIRAPESQQQLATLPSRLNQFDMAIFISANAVEGAARLIGDTLPAALQLAAVGDSTRRAVERHWRRPVISPAQGWNSEALLATGKLQQLNGRRIIIFRGQGGRELLAQTLSQRGAAVEYAEVYRRVRPGGDLRRLMAHDPPPDVITATSNETLQNLYDMAARSQREWLLQRQLVVIGERAADLAVRLGFQHPAIVAAHGNEQGLVEAMTAWRRDNNH
ncbi:hypothetical protein Tel_02360 [Candidatus Tenderia electrophaga]|uniref:Uroporphyrinogen-III synthase n=1 Tax=Candidatus Tenderia electrophaga TaxID=1748243 RepID=A0A0S2TA89_9GAMM|nr:hypothetical protein Tel_02360 [Candidatus Tenderia electrophaga]